MNGRQSCVNGLVEEAAELTTAARDRATAKTLAASMNAYLEGIGRPDVKTSTKKMRELRNSVMSNTDAGNTAYADEALYKSLAGLDWKKITDPADQDTETLDHLAGLSTSLSGKLNRVSQAECYQT